jgi:SNF2 family DNA or RNA helicase
MIRVDIHDDVLTVEAPARLAPLIARIPGIKAGVTGVWFGDPTYSTLAAIMTELSGLEGFEATERATSFLRAAKDDVALIRECKADPTHRACMDERLFDYQHAGVSMLLGGSCLLGDEMGTGKTVMALTAARIVGGPMLVVAPNSMKYRWQEEAAVWYPEASTFVVAGTAKKKEATIEAAQGAWAAGDRPVIVITNWESMRTLTRMAGYGSIKLTDKEKSLGPLNRIPWNIVCADEAHRAKDAKSKQTRALWRVSRGARYRWALTGTPVLNTPGDLWSIGRFYAPDEYGDSRHSWHNRYIDFIETNWGPKDIGLRKDRQKEFEWWFDASSIRRTKEDVLDLPEVTYQTRHLDLDPKQASAYKKMLDDLIVRIDGGILLVTDPLALLIRLSQIASATPVIGEDGIVGLIDPSNKVKAVLELLDELGEKQLVVFAQSRKLIELLESALDKRKVSHMSITGAVKPEIRTFNVNEFQAGRKRVALCTLGAGSEGINLFAADTVCFMQRSYSYGMSQQAEARVHRIGQERPVTVIDLVSKDTVDEDVIEALYSKSEMAEEVLRDRARQLLRIVDAS